MNDVILKIGLSQYGIKEIVGKQDNPEVLKYFKALGFGDLHDETAWCSAYMNWVAIMADCVHSGKLNARSWLNVGFEVIGKPVMGNVVVFWREDPKSWKGHVGIFIRQSGPWLYVLGGNQGNQVKISAYHENRLLSVRKLISSVTS